ncbi:hypothetical protein WP8S17C03_11540 [Metapseudomonas otitidis]|uniref:BRCT domain-containing protein n=1 Tax=Metapseudomonas otitidis TaxID=319939 RepID=A0A6S5RQ48_9GAMM|nr:BRCT domain-containing protein [Pseudomonas otitidis]BBT15105.1 hypothetical protein WP8S17C03_11540 [Pseudomonas otitidis]
MTDLHEEFGNSRFYNQSRMDRRSADALVGVAAGLIADGNINQAEAEFLQRWLQANLTHLDDPVINILYQRVQAMLSDGVLDAEESAELLEILNQFAGLNLNTPDEPAKPKEHAVANRLPLNDPQPDLEFEGRVFVFTGTMAYGPRKAVAELASQAGATVTNTISRKVHYLVIGSIGNDQWLHSSYGTKIKAALDLRNSGEPIAIIDEDYFLKHVLGC